MEIKNKIQKVELLFGTFIKGKKNGRTYYRWVVQQKNNSIKPYKLERELNKDKIIDQMEI